MTHRSRSAPPYFVADRSHGPLMVEATSGPLGGATESKKLKEIPVPGISDILPL